jgi:uncharacterized protein YbcV (DUF1398 family)
MFTLQQIKDAHAKVKSGADYPNYVQQLIQFGVVQYDTYLSDGHTEYRGKNNYTIRSSARDTLLEVADIRDNEKFIRFLKEHQQGKTDFITFCKQAAETGVEKWSVSMSEMTCTYYDKAGNKMLAEEIPTP